MRKHLCVGIDMAATAGQKSGFGHYLTALMEAIKALPWEEQNKQVIVPFTTITRDLNTPERWLWDQIGVPLTAMTKRVDLLFVPTFSAPMFLGPIVMTANDIYGVIHADAFSGLAKQYWVKTLPHSMRRADRLLCISQYTQKTVVEQLGIAKEKTVVVPISADDYYQKMSTDEARPILKSLGVAHKRYLLSVGTLEPRKNFARLVDAFAVLAKKDDSLTMVLVGKKGWSYDEIFARIKKHRLQHKVVWLGYVDHAGLRALYNGCALFVMPSIFEGFGMPVLEALRCGAPVAYADNTSMPEVGGRAGLGFDPYNIDQIADVCEHLLNSEAARQLCQQHRDAQVAKFSWRKTALETLAHIREVGLAYKA